jgi:hypothetical protein
MAQECVAIRIAGTLRPRLGGRALREIKRASIFSLSKEAARGLER